MNILLWILQILTAIFYGASRIVKVVLFDMVSTGVPSLGALPRRSGRPSACANSYAQSV